MNSHWYLNKKYFHPVNMAFNKFLKDDKINLVDGGAAGEISQPFIVAVENIKFVRFEPRGSETVLSNKDEIYIDGGVWSHDCSESLHVAEAPSTSSICPPDMEYLSKFNDINVNVRRTNRVVDVNLRSIDSCVASGEILKPDFIKLDVHSAELPALIGSVKSIDSCLGLLIETWHNPVHKGQGLHWQIEKFAIDYGFEVYDIVCAANWKHKYNNSVDYFDKGQYIGSEILLIKKYVDQEKLIKKSFLLVLFGYGNDAKSCLSHVKDAKTRTSLIESIEHFQRNRKRSIYLNMTKFIYRLKDCLAGLISS